MILHVHLFLFFFFFYSNFLCLYTLLLEKARKSKEAIFVDVRQICSLSCMEKKYINSEERIEILNVAGGRALKRTNNLLLPLVLFLPLSFSSASLPTNPVPHLSE